MHTWKKRPSRGSWLFLILHTCRTMDFIIISYSKTCVAKSIALYFLWDEQFQFGPIQIDPFSWWFWFKRLIYLKRKPIGNIIKNIITYIDNLWMIVFWIRKAFQSRNSKLQLFLCMTFPFRKILLSRIRFSAWNISLDLCCLSCTAS